MLKKIFLSILLFSISLIAGNIVVSGAYVRAVPPNLPNSASFMKIMNNSSKDIYLESAKSNLAKNLELHEHVKNGNMMKMQQVKKIKIPANGMVELKPGGYHIMFFGLNKVLKDGDKVDSIELYFSDKETIYLKNIPIKSVMSGMSNMKMKGM